MFFTQQSLCKKNSNLSVSLSSQHFLQSCHVLLFSKSLKHVTLQALYSYTTTSSAKAPADRPAAATIMPELHVEGFDAEQIWLQLDMASAQLVRRAKRLLKKAGSEPSLLTPETEEDLSGQHAAFLSVQLTSFGVAWCQAHRCSCTRHLSIRRNALALHSLPST